MRKSTKLAILVAALVALCSMAALAADTWKAVGDDWYCYDSDGNMVYGAMKKYGSNYYYLDDLTGAMVRNKCVDVNGDKYYFGADGVRVAEAWEKVPVENDDDGWEYMYFKSNGKAATGLTTIKRNVTENGVTKKVDAKYYFNSDGYMQYGYLDAEYFSADYPSASTYYFGTKEEGFRYTGWINITDGSDSAYSEKDSVWFYYGSNGKKIKDSIQYKVASGKKYNFNADGAMVYGWAKSTDSAPATGETSAVGFKYYGGANEGTLLKNAWKQTTSFNKDDDETSYWFYCGSDGSVYYGTSTSSVKKIKSSGKYYCFRTNGKMVSGVVFGKVTNVSDQTTFVLDEAATDKIASVDDVTGHVLNDKNDVIMYFSGDYDNDGAMKTGAQTITINGDELNMMFDKHGIAYEGYKSKKIYNNGVLQSAGDSRVAVKRLNTANDTYAAGTFFLVSSSGNTLSKYKSVDADGVYWAATGEYAHATGEKVKSDLYKMAELDYASKVADIVKASTDADWTNDVYTGASSTKFGDYTYKITRSSHTNTTYKTHDYYNVYWQVK